MYVFGATHFYQIHNERAFFKYLLDFMCRIEKVLCVFTDYGSGSRYFPAEE